MTPIEEAAEALARGDLVVLPTDTVYGLASAPGATAKLFDAKARPRSLTLPVLVANARDATRVALLDDRACRLAERFWPGGLTLVLRRTPDWTKWDLGEERATVGVRVPDHPLTRALLRATGPLAVTSANRSGEPTPTDCHGVRAVFGDQVAVYLCDDPRPAGPPSTVLDLSGPEPRVLREGAIAPSELLAALG